jgi:hypothetical protein
MFNYYSYVIVIFVVSYDLLACEGDWLAYEICDILGDIGF